MAFNYSPKVITNGLVLCLDAANTRSYPGSGTAWNDLSRSGNNGTLVNGPTFNSANGGSIVFDGTDDFVTIPNSTSINITGSSITVSVWVKFQNTGVYKSILIKDAPTTNIAGYQLYISNTQQSRWGITTSGGFNFMFGSTLSTNTWYNITGTYNGSTNFLYENAILVNSQSCSGNIVDSSLYSAIMGRYRFSGEPLNGNIAITQIYNRFLSSTEILQNYNATKTRFGL